MTEMEEIINEIVPTEDLKKFEKIYQDELSNGNATNKSQFEYAWCLVRSRYPADIKRGIIFLEDLTTRHSEGKRDYIYYLAVAHTRIKEYRLALKYAKAFLQIEPSNQQVIALEEFIKKKIDGEQKVGMAVAGGAALVLGGLVGIGLALSKK